MADRTLPPQHQSHRPGRESEMTPQPCYLDESYKPAGKLAGKTAIVTGGDSGIGRAVALYFALEGAKVAVVYLSEHDDAETTRKEIERRDGQVTLHAGDVASATFCQEVVSSVVSNSSSIDILVNNAGEQHPQKSLADISEQQWERTFKTNVFGMFQLTKAALPYLVEGSSIINTTSVTAYQGQPILLDYSASKGAITAFTRSLAKNLAEQGIRVNAVAPGPIWTPLIPSTFDEESVEQFGANTPLDRPGQPAEVAPAFVYLASADSNYVSGQVMHVNGGRVVNG